MPFYEGQDAEVPSAIITCDCAAECVDIHIQKDEEEVLGPKDKTIVREFYISMQPKSNLRFPLVYKLKLIWMILKQGHLHVDCMILEPDTVRHLTDWLEKNNTPLE